MKSLPIILIFSAILLTFSLSACSSSTGPAATTNGPGVGSTFNYVTTQTDLNGVPTGSDMPSSQTVTGSGLTIGGRSGVVSESSTSGQQVQYMVYEGNGDVSFYNVLTNDGVPIHSFWMAFPFGSQSPKDYSWDSTWQGTYHADTMEFTYHFTYLGTGSITVNGKTFPTQRVKSVLHLHGNATLWQIADATNIVDYSPDLKQFVKQVITQTTQDSFFGTQSNIYTTTLVGYSLK